MQIQMTKRIPKQTPKQTYSRNIIEVLNKDKDTSV